MVLLAWVGVAGAARAAPAASIAVFGFSLDNTSPAASSPAELARTAGLGPLLTQALQGSGRYRAQNVAPAAALLHGEATIRGCNGCERQAARKLGAGLAAYGWVQKVSDLILNINLVIEDVASGRMVAGGSVDIRGNTDESWHRGLQFLIQERVLPRG